MNALIRWLASQASSSSAQRPRGSSPERDLVLEPYFDVFADAALLPLDPCRATLLSQAYAAGWSPAWSFGSPLARRLDGLRLERGREKFTALSWSGRIARLVAVDPNSRR